MTKLSVGVKALIVKEGKVLLIREAKYDEGTEEGKWDLPGGRIKPEESLLQGLIREVYEESGLAVSVSEVLSVTENFVSINGELNHIIRISYLVQHVQGEVVLSNDHDAYEWVDLTNLNGKECMSGVADLVMQYLQK